MLMLVDLFESGFDFLLVFFQFTLVLLNER